MSNFSFSNLNNSDESSEYETWAQKIKTQHNSFGKPSNSSFGAWKRRTNESGSPSPELWKRPDSPKRCPERNLSDISNSSSAQTMAKYRQEMLELVQGMPESNYELSLRDMVESPEITTPLKEKEESSNKKKKEKKTTISRSESMEVDKGGLLLKMFIPSVLGGDKSVECSENRSKVSPSREREWWSDEFGQMTSSSGSSGSSNSSGRRKNRKLRVVIRSSRHDKENHGVLTSRIPNNGVTDMLITIHVFFIKVLGMFGYATQQLQNRLELSMNNADKLCLIRKRCGTCRRPILQKLVSDLPQHLGKVLHV